MQISGCILPPRLRLLHSLTFRAHDAALPASGGTEALRMNPHCNPRFTFASKSEGAFLRRAGPRAAQHFANARWKASPALLAGGSYPREIE